MIFVTGDTHGNIDIHKLKSKNFPIGKGLSKEDYLIICGDFGLRWSNSREEQYWLNWLDSKPWTTLWIDGNHENFDMLSKYPIEDWKGGKIQKITDSIYHLCRGSVFEIDGKKIFAFGGAESHDKMYRELGVSLWLEEMPSKQEMEVGKRNLEKHNWEVDIVLTHSLPTNAQYKYFNVIHGYNYMPNELTDYFEEIQNKLKYKLWFSGHYHKSDKCNDNIYIVYDAIHKIGSDGTEVVNESYEY